MAVNCPFTSQICADGLWNWSHFWLPAHDQRDLDFALNYNLPVLPVVLPKNKNADEFQINKVAYTGPGCIINRVSTV